MFEMLKWCSRLTIVAVLLAGVCHLQQLQDRLTLRPSPDERLLVAASGGGAVDDIEAALSAGASVQARDAGGGTALMYAAGRGDIATVERLLAAGADVN